ncbi:MAG: PleD family two-component system response regulator [Robiginitomaculum sp.]|nr:PleD family two-component system response regulator [Robiginitomaculum sp.]
MTGRILVVDDMEPNIRVLSAKLEAEYYEVISANSGAAAIALAREQQPDLILLDVMMPQMDGFETCRRLKADPITQHIPVVMVTALDQQTDRVDGLQAGADDFLSKPIDDVALFARVRSLLRLNSVMNELRSHLNNGQGADAANRLMALSKQLGGKVLVVEESERFGNRIAEKLGESFSCQITTDPKTASAIAATGFDLILINLATSLFDGLRLCARLRADEATRQLPILCMVDVQAKDRSVRALDLGVNDILERPVDRHELRARCQTLLQRRVYATQLRENIDQSLEMAFSDQLTGLFNRRHLDIKLEELVQRFNSAEEPSVVLIVDIDHFKQVNDTWGHVAGDMVLQQLATIMRESFRAIDIICRYGGEEFVVLMPDASLDSAKLAAERFRQVIAATNFDIGQGKEPIRISVSGGLAALQTFQSAKQVLSKADAALYHAKKNGRNQMIAAITGGNNTQIAG